MKKTDEDFHEIDGIIELNHPAPYWWQILFYLTSVWALGYGAYYLLGPGELQSQELAAKLASIAAKQVVPSVSFEEEGIELRAIYADPAGLAKGSQVYAKNCVSCHADDGGGGIGPNLTDSSWIHGDGSLHSILKIVREGVSEKGMPPWGPILAREETLRVSAFVRSLRGKASAKPKGAQGSVIDYTGDL